ncbi:NAD-P-binding protein [Cubamyces sp. BRFM 1775]|nr:NAD-P-binding protein [Cubamyces sp. BRFM 1775]
MPSFAVIGASRGIGLEFVRQLARKSDSQVFAVVRDPHASYLQPDLEGHKNVHVIQADVTDPHSCQRAAQEISALCGGALDVLIHCAANTDRARIFRGFDDYRDLEELDVDFVDAFKVNALGVIHSISTLLPLLRRGTEKKIVVLNTEGASPTLTLRSGAADVAAYCTTKAATAMITAKYATGLGHEGFVVVSMAPGLVNTSATAGAEATQAFQAVMDRMTEAGLRPELLTPEQSVVAQLKVIASLSAERNGEFLSYTGDVIPY